MATQLQERVPAVQNNLEQLTDTLRVLAGVLLDESCDDDFLRPSEAAFDLAWQTVSRLPLTLSCEFPATYCASIGNGGLTLVWELPGREVALTIADVSGTISHVYARTDGQPGAAVDGASSTALAEALLGNAQGG